MKATAALRLSCSAAKAFGHMASSTYMKRPQANQLRAQFTTLMI
jgi:hypothetical protein